MNFNLENFLITEETSKVLIGKGMFSTVLKARHKNGTDYAIKIVR